jgi:hypothetical protein
LSVPDLPSRPNVPAALPDGWIICTVCAVPVIHIERHMKKVHALGDRTPSQRSTRVSSRCPRCKKRVRYLAEHQRKAKCQDWCDRCKSYVSNLTIHLQKECTVAGRKVKPPVNRDEAKRLKDLSLLRMLHEDLRSVPRSKGLADKKMPLPMETFTRDRPTRPFSGLGGSCWKCGARLFSSGLCSDSSCTTRISEQ